MKVGQYMYHPYPYGVVEVHCIVAVRETMAVTECGGRVYFCPKSQLYERESEALREAVSMFRQIVDMDADVLRAIIARYDAACAVEKAAELSPTKGT